MRTSRTVQLAPFAMAVFGGVETALANPIYSFTTINVPGAATTQAYAINNSGQIVGTADLDSFLYTGGSSTFNVPGAVSTLAHGINDTGQIVGRFAPGLRPVLGFLDTGGSHNQCPGQRPGTNAYGINDSGQIVGFFLDASISRHGFLDTSGSFTTIDVPGAGPLVGTVANGINDSGQIVGIFNDATGAHGFLASPVPEPPSSFTLATF